MSRVCRICGVPLIVGENTTQKRIGSRNYICRRCLNECNQDYAREYRQQHQDELKKYNYEYYHMHQDEMNKRRREYDYRNGRHQSMCENKYCALYLGCHVAERVLSRVFKNVKRMPTNNPGYDFVCSRDYKIDVKSSCRSHRKDGADRWSFHIGKNQMPDYFLCLAFDTRESLNPEHLWLLPAETFNNKVGISISTTRLTRWNSYKLDVDKVVSCCNSLRGDKK